MKIKSIDSKQHKIGINWRDGKHTLAKIELTKEKVASAQEDLDLMQEKYNLGAANILELLDAEVSFKQAESDQVEALYDHNLAVAQFEKAIGK